MKNRQQVQFCICRKMFLEYTKAKAKHFMRYIFPKPLNSHRADIYELAKQMGVSAEECEAFIFASEFITEYYIGIGSISLKKTEEGKC